MSSSSGPDAITEPGATPKEEATLKSFNVELDGESCDQHGRPYRILVDYCIKDNKGRMFWKYERNYKLTHCQITGTLTRPGEERRQPVALPAYTRLVLHVEEGAQRGVWLETKFAWYMLREPSVGFAKFLGSRLHVAGKVFQANDAFVVLEQADKYIRCGRRSVEVPLSDLINLDHPRRLVLSSDQKARAAEAAMIVRELKQQHKGYKFVDDITEEGLRAESDVEAGGAAAMATDPELAPEGQQQQQQQEMEVVKEGEEEPPALAGQEQQPSLSLMGSPARSQSTEENEDMEATLKRWGSLDRTGIPLEMLKNTVDALFGPGAKPSKRARKSFVTALLVSTDYTKTSFSSMDGASRLLSWADAVRVKLEKLASSSHRSGGKKAEDMRRYVRGVMGFLAVLCRALREPRLAPTPGVWCSGHGPSIFTSLRDATQALMLKQQSSEERPSIEEAHRECVHVLDSFGGLPPNTLDEQGSLGPMEVDAQGTGESGHDLTSDGAGRRVRFGAGEEEVHETRERFTRKVPVATQGEMWKMQKDGRAGEAEVLYEQLKAEPVELDPDSLDDAEVCHVQ